MGDAEGFGWLHLTDLHIGAGTHALWPTQQDKFFENLPNVHKWSGGRWNAIFFTGDLVYSGEEAEYEEFEKFRQLLMKTVAGLNGGIDPLFLAIPGNHDLHRPKSLIVYAAKAFEHEPKLRHDFWDQKKTNELRAAVQKSLAAWKAWSSDLLVPDLTEGLLPGDFSVTIEPTPDFFVGVVGLNSTFLQLDDGDWKGHLALGVEQLNKVCDNNPPAWIKQHDVTFLLTHHPPDWLYLDQGAFSEIAPDGRFDVHLFGHEHVGEAYSGSKGFSESRLEILGRSLFGLQKRSDGPNNLDRSHGFSAGRICVSPDVRANVVLWPRHAKNPGGGWRFYPDATYVLADDRGTNRLRLGDRPRRGAPPPPGQPQPGGGVRGVTRATGALEEDYSRWLLNSSDRLDLQRFFGQEPLPTGSRRIRIDELYVSTRVARERSSSDSVDGSARGMSASAVGETPAPPDGLASASTGASSAPSTAGTRGVHTERISLGTAMSNWRHIVLLGKAGAGKSTLIRWAATVLLLRRQTNRRLLKGEETVLPGEELVPIVIDLGNVTALPETVRDLIVTIGGIRDLSEPDQAALSARLTDAWRRGTAVLFLDGLDEAGAVADGLDTAKLRNDLAEWIADQGAGYQHARIVVTSRISGYSEVPARIPSFEHVTLADLTLQDKVEFAYSWARLFADPPRQEAAVEELLNGFVEHERLTATPQLMTYMAALWQLRGAFPASRTELFGSLVELLCSTRRRVVPDAEWRPQLHYIAHSICDGQNLDELHLARLREAMSNDLSANDFAWVQRHEPDDFLRLMARNASILTVRRFRATTSGRRIPVYEFPHPTFVEFLAGRAIAAGQFSGGGE